MDPLKKEKKFSLASLGKDARRRAYEESFLWLDDAKIANTAYNATDPNVAQAFAANGRRLYFYSRYDLERMENRMEVDFLIRCGDAISPVEVQYMVRQPRLCESEYGIIRVCGSHSCKA